LHIAQQMPLALTISCSSKSRLVLAFLVLPFWYLLTRVDPAYSRPAVKRLCVCVCSSDLLFSGKYTRWELSCFVVRNVFWSSRNVAEAL